jgi:hypothetical protein
MEATETTTVSTPHTFKAYAGFMILLATSRNWRQWRDASGNINVSGILFFITCMAMIFGIAAGIDFFRERRQASSPKQLLKPTEGE